MDRVSDEVEPMARVVLPFVRHKEVAPLPPVCIRCGKPATRTLEMQFHGRVIRFLGIRIYAFRGMEDYVVVPTPLCDGHPFMGQATSMMVLGFLILLPFFGLGALTRSWFHHYLIVYPLIALIVAASVMVAYAFFTSIDGEGFDDKGVTVTRVCPEFIEGMKAHDWTDDEVVAGIRKNRKARVKPKRTVWTSPFFFVPLSVVFAFAIFTPIGCLVASREPPGGPWPAGLWAERQPVPGAPVQPAAQGQPPHDAPTKHREPFDPRSLPGLSGYWPLDEGRGTGTEDASGHGILVILHGGQWVPGVRGTALRLDGKGDYLDLGPAGNWLSFGDRAPFTVACWVNTTTDQGAISSFRRRGKGFPVVDLLIKNGRVRGWVRDDTSGQGGAIVVGGLINDGAWHHVALIRRDDGMVELHVDGVLQAKDKGQSSGGPITTDLHTLGTDLFVVETGRKGPPNFAGTIDEFCVFNRALAGQEIAILTGGKK
jgi:hypothetical protein